MTGLLSFAIPSLMPEDPNSVYRPIDRNAVSLDNWGAAMLVGVTVIGLTMFLFGFVGLWLADSGLNRERSWGARARLGPVIGGRFILLVLLSCRCSLLLLAPFMIAFAIAIRRGCWS